MLQYDLLGQGPKRHRHVSFAVEGVIAEDYDRSFAERGGIEKFPDLILPDSKTTRELVSEYVPPHIASKLTDLDDVDELSERLSAVTLNVETKDRSAASVDRPDTKQRLLSELDAMRAGT